MSVDDSGDQMKLVRDLKIYFCYNSYKFYLSDNIDELLCIYIYIYTYLDFQDSFGG